VGGLIASRDEIKLVSPRFGKAPHLSLDKSPFSEFRWADFLRLRLRVARTLIERDFSRTFALAMDLAQTTEAAALTGWRRHPEH
jgi:hypothetical protein